MPVESPVVQTFFIRSLGWSFVDDRNVDPRELYPMIILRHRELLRFYESIPEYDGVDICEIDMNIQTEIHRRFNVAVTRNPRLTWTEFEDAGGTMIHSACADPRLFQFNFGIRDRTGWIGGCHMGNIQIERDEVDGVQATGFFWLGTPRHPDHRTRGETWSAVMRWIILNDITFEGGRPLDIVGFNFLGEPSYRWRKSLNPELVELLSGLSADVDEVDDADNDAVQTVRRRGVTLGVRNI